MRIKMVNTAPRFTLTPKGAAIHADEQITEVVKSESMLNRGSSMSRFQDHSQPERLTITLLAMQRKKLARLASERHVSLATVIRWAIDDYLKHRSSPASRKEPMDAA